MKEIRALTGIRGVAALTVFLSHTQSTLLGQGIPLSAPLLIQRLLLSGGRQVDVFFVLSGFILTLIYGSEFNVTVGRSSYLKFLRKRLARIYPLHAFMLILIAAFVLLARFSHAHVTNGIDRFNFSALPLNFLLIHAWGIDSTDASMWNPPSWSISIEFLAYLLFPLFLAVTVNARRQHRWLLLLGVLACGLLTNALSIYWGMYWGQLGFSGISRGLTEFALGSVCVSFFSGGVADWLRTNIGSSLALIALLVCYALTPETSFAIAVFAAPLLLGLSGKNYLSTFLSWTPIYFLGEISYSIYLGHFLFASIAYRLVSLAWMRSGLFATSLGLLFIAVFVLSLSTVTYYAIERPGRDWLTGKRSRGHSQALTAVRQGDIS